MFVFDKTIEPLTAKNAPEFLKTTWNLIDEDGDGNLTRSELRNALGNQFSQRKFSRMICYHQSEWGNDYASIKPEVETLLDEGIEKETVDEKKQKLKENKTIVLDRLEKKLADFDFWGKVQEPEITISDKGDFKNYTPTSFKLKLKGKKVIKTLPFVFPLYKGPIFKELDLPEIPKVDISFNTIPAKPELYHFHPIAFVEQMKRLIGVWHDPVMNPMLCLYTQNGNYRPNHNVFGYVRTTNKNKKHQGVDLLAKPNTPLFACFDGKVIRTETQSGYGKIIMIQIDDIETLKTCKIDYNLKYEDKGELSEGDGFNLKGSIYLFYAHLNSFCVEVGELVKSGQVIGKSGTTGYGSSKDPHLHFEIRNKVSSRGLNNRCNPAFFVDYKNENEMSESEKKYQKTIAEKYWD